MDGFESHHSNWSAEFYQSLACSRIVVDKDSRAGGSLVYAVFLHSTQYARLTQRYRVPVLQTGSPWFESKSGHYGEACSLGGEEHLQCTCCGFDSHPLHYLVAKRNAESVTAMARSWGFLSLTRSCRSKVNKIDREYRSPCSKVGDAGSKPACGGFDSYGACAVRFGDQAGFISQLSSGSTPGTALREYGRADECTGLENQRA